ncbi:TPR repeat-containing protein YrrB [bacterium BMS3Bbin08]|nr:TPR repeat-containing protein YrrB [bacterium BMS3Bbin08]
MKKPLTKTFKMEQAEIEIVTHTQKYKPYEIEKNIIEYLYKVPKRDLKGISKINIYDDCPDYFPENIAGSYYPRELKGKAEIDIYLYHALPYMLVDELLARFRNKLFLLLFGKVFIAYHLFHEIGYHKYTEIFPKLYKHKDKEESDKDAVDYSNKLLGNVFPFRMRYYNFFNILYKFLYRERIKKAEKIRSKPRALTPEYYDAQSETYLRLKEYEKAVIEFTKLIELNPNYPNAYFNRGFANANLGKRKEAVEDYTKAIDLNPDDPIVYYNRGISYHEMKEWREAIDDYTQAINLKHPNAVDIYRGRAYCYSETGDYQKSIKDFTNVINIDLANADAYYDRGYVYAMRGKYEEAINDLTKAINLNPKNVDAYKFRGTLYNKKGQHDKAIKDFTQAINLNTQYVETYFERGWCYYQKGDYENAINDYTSALNLNPDYTQVYYNLAGIYSILKEEEKACKFLKKAVSKGFSDFEHMKKDPDFINIKENECYREIIKSRAKSKIL